MLTAIFLLLIAFQVKHLLADYFLQTEYMLGKFAPGREFVLPLVAHCAVHAAGTFLILILSPIPFYITLLCCAIDFNAHFVMDRLKAAPNLGGAYKSLSSLEMKSATEYQKNRNSWFWRILGIDQFVHHLTHYYIISLVILYLR